MCAFPCNADHAHALFSTAPERATAALDLLVADLIDDDPSIARTAFEAFYSYATELDRRTETTEFPSPQAEADHRERIHLVLGKVWFTALWLDIGRLYPALDEHFTLDQNRLSATDRNKIRSVLLLLNAFKGRGFWIQFRANEIYLPVYPPEGMVEKLTAVAHKIPSVVECTRLLKTWLYYYCSDNHSARYTSADVPLSCRRIDGFLEWIRPDAGDPRLDATSMSSIALARRSSAQPSSGKRQCSPSPARTRSAKRMHPSNPARTPAPRPTPSSSAEPTALQTVHWPPSSVESPVQSPTPRVISSAATLSPPQQRHLASPTVENLPRSLTLSVPSSVPLASPDHQPPSLAPRHDDPLYASMSVKNRSPSLASDVTPPPSADSRSYQPPPSNPTVENSPDRSSHSLASTRSSLAPSTRSSWETHCSNLAGLRRQYIAAKKNTRGCKAELSRRKEMVLDEFRQYCEPSQEIREQSTDISTPFSQLLRAAIDKIDADIVVKEKSQSKLLEARNGLGFGTLPERLQSMIDEVAIEIDKQKGRRKNLQAATSLLKEAEEKFADAKSGEDQVSSDLNLKREWMDGWLQRAQKQFEDAYTKSEEDDL